MPARYILIIFSVLYVLTQYVYADFACVESVGTPKLSTYSTQISACMTSTSPGSISQYVCAGATSCEKAYQTVVSLEFAKIDEKVYTYLRTLSENRSKNPAIWVESISRTFDVSSEKNTFLSAYTAVCSDTAWREVLKHFGQGSTTEVAAYISGAGADTPCNRLVYRKMKAYKDMAYMLAMEGISRSYTSDTDAYMDKLSKKYVQLLDTTRQYIGSLERATAKCPKSGCYVKTPSMQPR